MSQRHFEMTSEVLIRSMHNLDNPDLTPAENQALYGRCYGQHGHHYRVRVTLAGKPDPVSGLVFDRDRLEKILQASIVKPLDGMDLNELFPNTACEALARAIYLRLRPLFPDGMLTRVSIQETRKNYFEFPPEDAAAYS